MDISAGGVVYRRRKNIEFALTLKSGAEGVWCLPKGLIEKGEEMQTAAAREVKEETGLEVADRGWLDKIEYWYIDKEASVRIHKLVYFFLFEWIGGDEKNHDWEVAKVSWFPPEEAADILAYEGERDIVREAATMIPPPEADEEENASEDDVGP